MKHFYKTALFALLSNIAMAQTFFAPTTYRGAFEPGVPMWTNNWTNWDPQNTVYSTGKTPTDWTNANITTNTTWTADKIYTVKQPTYVKNGAVLTIQPGTVVLFDKAAVGAGLFITMGAKIMAQGTATSPIVFTSNQAPGSRGLGDWGGIVLLGKASNNQVGGVAYIEGLAPTADTQHGGGTGADDADNSGVLSYVRIEWGGYIYQPDKEINGITFGSVGSKTTVDHIQVSFANDDAFEWFGGTVNCRNLVAYRCLDDDYDTDFGYRGFVQFGLTVRDPQIADQSAGSTSEGFESDNDASGTTTTPQTAPIFSNMTMVGPYRGSTTNTIDGKFRRGARIRRNSALKIYNSIFMDYNRGIHIDAAACETNATNGTLKFMNNIVAGSASGKVCERNAGSTFNIWAWFASSKNDSIATTAGLLNTPYSYTEPDYRPSSGSLALSGADFTDLKISPYVLNAPIVTSSLSYCEGATAAALTATPVAGASLWFYTTATGGTGSATAPTPSTSIAGVTTYYVSQSIYGAESMRATITVTVNALPLATITASGSTTFCAGESVTLMSNASIGNVWSTNATSNSILASTTGTYTVTVTDANTCSATSAPIVITVNALPVPTITASGATSFCDGESVMLMSNMTSGNTWSTSESTDMIEVSNEGTYTLTVTDANACSASVSKMITVYELPDAEIIAGGSTSFCTGGSVTLTSTSSTGNVWSNSQTSKSIAVTTSGSYYTVVTDANACVDTSNTIIVNVSSAPVPTIANKGSLSFCEGDSVVLTSSTSDSYLWSNSATSKSITVKASGSYSVTTTNTDACLGAGTSAVTVITVHALPVATITATGSTTFCAGGSVTLTSSATSGNLWSSNATSNSITASTASSYSVTVTDANSCSATSVPTMVMVNALPIATITASGSTSFCEGQYVTLTSGATSGNVWSSAETSNSIVVLTAGSYSVTVTDANSCSATSAPIVVTVGAIPVAMATVASKEVPVLTFSNTSTGATSYMWDFGDNTSSTQMNPTHAYALNGTYTIKLIAMLGMCSDTISLTEIINVGISEIEISNVSVSIYPNPVNEQATLELNLIEASNMTIHVYDISGQLIANVFQGQMSAGKTNLTLNTSNLVSGVYFTSIISDNAQKVVKLVVEK